MLGRIVVAASVVAAIVVVVRWRRHGASDAAA